MATKDRFPTLNAVQSFLLLAPMVESIKNEMAELSKKKPDGTLNELKVKMINKRLKPMKRLLNLLPLADYLDELDNDSLPSNSDTVLILGQYSGAIESFRSTFRGRDGIYGGWDTDKGFVSDEDL